MRRPVILTFIRHYLPGCKSGGPVKSVANLVEALGDEFHFRIVTSDRDAMDKEPYPGLVPFTGSHKLGKAEIIYLPPGLRSPRNIARLLGTTPHDLLYLNSYFDPEFSLLPLLARRFLGARTPCILAPRGEFAPDALALKPARKKILLATAPRSRLHRGVLWQATSDRELEQIRSIMGPDCRVFLAANLPSPVHATENPYRAKTEDLRLCFLSRIAPMKNLDFALNVLREVRANVSFDMYGPVRDEAYWKSCQNLLRKLPAHVGARYCGHVEPSEVQSTLAAYDLFFLPSRGENFGHAIFEAMAAGTPVLISDRTPWRNLDEAGAGWEYPLTMAELFGRKVEQVAAMTASQLEQLSRRTRQFAMEWMGQPRLAEASRSLFLEAVG